jgi:hypothetical protein
MATRRQLAGSVGAHGQDRQASPGGGEVGLALDVGLGRERLEHATQREPGVEEAVHDRVEPPVVLDDVVAEPGGRAGPLRRVVVDRPVRGGGCLAPPLLGARGHHRVLHRGDDRPARC